MLSLGDFKRVSIDDRDLIKGHYRKHPPEHSDYLFGTMMAWQHYMEYRIAWRGDHLLMMTEHEGKKFIRPPIGPMDGEIFREAMDLSRRTGCSMALSMVGAGTKEWLSRNVQGLRFEPHRDYFEYVYLSRTLADLPGKRYLNVRNYLNKFRRENTPSVERMGEGNFKDAKDFLARWCQQRGCQDEPFMLQEREANLYSLDHLFDLELEGMLIRIDGTVQAISIYERMKDDMAVIHFEKANPDFQGLYQAINNETARSLAERYTYLNRESDMGIEGLRSVKERYGPDHMLEVHDALWA